MELLAGLEPATFCLPQKISLCFNFSGTPHKIISRSDSPYSADKTKIRPPKNRRSYFGATGRTRTGDLLITNQLLYQLSHSSIYMHFAKT